MTNEEAIKRIVEHMTIHKMNEPRAIKISMALQMAMYALEKQIPKKPIDIVWNYGAIREFKCPACKTEYYARGIKGLSKGKHCEECGQKLDWGENE